MYIYIYPIVPIVHDISWYIPFFLMDIFPYEPPAAIEAPQELTPAMPSDAEEEPEESIATWLQCMGRQWWWKFSRLQLT